MDNLHKSKQPIIVAGSPYGATIACRLAMNHPDLVDGLVLTGLAIGRQGNLFRYHFVIEHWSVRWFIPRSFRPVNSEKCITKENWRKCFLKRPEVYAW